MFDIVLTTTLANRHGDSAVDYLNNVLVMTVYV